MDIFSQLDKISDRESSPKKVLSANKKPALQHDVIVLSDRVFDYKIRTETFIKRYEKYLGQAFDYKVDSFTALAQWMVKDVAPAISNSSWRAYKLCLVNAVGHPEIERIMSQGAGYAKSAQLSRFQRQKHLQDEELSRLILTLNNSQSIYKSALIDWLKSTIATGLRPNEWSEAIIVYPDGLNIALKVRTKVKQVGEATVDCPEYRYIPLDHLPPDEIDCLNGHLSRYIEAVNQKTVQKLYDNCRKLLHYTSKITFKQTMKKSINIYSARHQFCANLKAADFESSTIALLMGHVSNATQTNNYARRSVGHPSNISKSLSLIFNNEPT